MAARGWVPGDTAADAPDKPSGEGVVVTGRIASADTGDPVAGVVIVVFKEGVTSKQVLAAKAPADLMLTRGQSGADGQFTLASKVGKGSYTVAVIGQGYKLVIEDAALVVGDDTPATYRAWNRIPITRCKSGADCIK